MQRNLIERKHSAHARYLPISAKKVRPLADNVRGLAYLDAVSILALMPHKGARLLRKVILSSASNVLQHNAGVLESALLVRTVMVDEGPSRVRIWPRGRGRADRLVRRSCHILVECIHQTEIAPKMKKSSFVEKENRMLDDAASLAHERQSKKKDQAADSSKAESGLRKILGGKNPLSQGKGISSAIRRTGQRGK